MKTITEISHKLSHSISLKIGGIAILILLLLIPAGMIKSLIFERMATREEVVNEVSDKWGQLQNLTGPVLVLPYSEITVVNQEEYITRRHLFVLPETLDIQGQVDPTIRYRGIYKVIVYGSNIQLHGHFMIPDLDQEGIDPAWVHWDKATVCFGLTDMRGIQNNLNMTWSQKTYSAEPGIKHNNIASTGFTFNLPVSSEEVAYSFSLALNLNGSKGLFFTPVGKTTTVQLKSAWPTPSFSGSFLPDQRHVGPTGFEANWTVLHLNRNYPQHWIDKTFDLTNRVETSPSFAGSAFTNDSMNHPNSAFGVNLLFEVDEYQKSMRSAKYAVMFIALTFLMFMLMEIINKKRIHPVQYLLVSFALLLFYTLLIALSEHIGFNLAYLVSAIAIIGLISFYSHSFFKSIRISVISTLSIGLLYLFLFIILQMEELSLLLGSIGVFIILGIVMYLSKKVDWYGSLKPEKTGETDPYP